MKTHTSTPLYMCMKLLVLLLTDKINKKLIFLFLRQNRLNEHYNSKLIDFYKQLVYKN